MVKLEEISWEAWRSACYDIGRLDMTGSSADDFSGRYRLAIRQGVAIATSECSFNVGENTAEIIKRHPEDNVTIQLIEAGEAVIRMDREEAVARIGDIVVRDWLRPHSIASTPEPNRLKRAKVFTVPRRSLENYLDRIDMPEQFIMRSDRPSSRVIYSLIASMEENFEEMDKHIAESFVESALDFVGNAFLLDPSQGFEVNVRELFRVQNELMSHMTDPDLSMAAFAKEIGMSPRSMQRLFQSIGTTPHRWIEAKRVRRIALEMTLPSNQKRSITDIAFSFGFNDLSTFFRAFKRHYKVSPSEYRASVGTQQFPFNGDD